MAGPGLRKLCDRDPVSVLLLVEKKPRLSLEPEIWRSPQHLQSEVLTRLSQNRDGLDTLLPGLVGVLLAAGNDQVAPDFVRTMGAMSLALVLDHFNAAEPPLPLFGPGWRSQLAWNDRETLQWLQSRQAVRGQTILLLTTALSPYGRATRDHGIPVWLRHLHACRQLAEEDYTRTMAFYLALALDGRSEEAVAAASASFDEVYRATAAGKLDDRSWGLLSDRLPRPSWWDEWDKCDMLRKAVVSRFVDRKWPADKFFEITSDDSILCDLVRCFKDSGAGRRFLRSVAQDARSGKIHTSEDRLRLIA